MGRVVVLAFVPGLSDSAAISLVRGFTYQADSLFGGDVVVASVVSAAGVQLEPAVRSMDIRLKLLPDTAGAVRRLYGVTRGNIAVYVIDALGRVSWRDLNVNPYVSASYTKIRNAVAKARAASQG